MEALRLKVCYLIFSSHPRSGGGHFHSLRTISETLSDQVAVKVINAGVVLGKTLEDMGNVEFIAMRRNNFPMALLRIFKSLHADRPDVLHAFDFKSLWIARTIGWLLGIPVIFNKCGGRNGSSFIPSADASVMFSGENLEHYKKYQNSGSPLYLIPNRATIQPQDLIRIDALRKAFNLADKHVILRISRVHPYYHRTYRQAIALLKSRLQTIPNTVLLFVGFVQDEDFFERLKREAAGLPIHFIIDMAYCRKAAELISVAQTCVATGRGVMEASSVGVPVYCPVADAELPVLLCQKTLPRLLHYNFSERAAGIAPATTYSATEIGDRERVKQIFSEHFDVAKSASKYLKIYKEAKRSSIAPVNYISHGLRFIQGLR